MGLRFIEILTYLGSGVLCLVTGALLVFVDNGNSEQSKGYMKVKAFVALAAFLDAILSFIFLYFLSKDYSYLCINTFLAPLVFYFQVFMATSSLLMLFRSPYMSKHLMYIFIWPVVVLTLSHGVGYLVEFGFVFDIPSYISYVNTTYSMVVSMLMYMVILVVIACLAVILLRAVKQYNKTLENYYAEYPELSGKRLDSVVMAFFLYGILSMINLLSFSRPVVVGSVIVASVLFVVFAVALVNLQRLFSLVSPAFAYERMADRKPSEEPAETMPEPSESSVSMSMDDAVYNWTSRQDKPYLKRGITVASVSAEMKISPRVLSDYLNNVYEVNFNTWINTLRLEQAAEMMLENPKLPFKDLYAKVGFSDLAAFAKAFKKCYGMAPGQFRTEKCNK